MSSNPLISRSLVATALLGALAASFTPVASAADGAKEKCFGIAKAGQNDCANLSGSHSCAGQAKVDGGADEWKYVAKGECAGMGGKSMAEAKSAMGK